jgi:hypothetical protein
MPKIVTRESGFEADLRYIYSYKLVFSPGLETRLGKSPGKQEDLILPYLPVENQEQPVENIPYLCGNAGEFVGKTEAKDKNCKQRYGD